MLTEITLKNFRTHVDKKFTFKPGLNLIVGPNGSGKSSIIQALSGLVTGSFATDRNKADNITLGSSGGSRITGEFLAPDGRSCQVTRSVSTSEAEFTGSGVSCTGSAAVTEAVLAFLGTSDQIFKQYVFAEQGEAGAVLEGTKDQRQSALNRLFGVERFEKLRKTLSEHLNSQPRFTHPQVHQENLEKWHARISTLSREMEVLRKQREALVEIPGTASEDDETIRRYRRSSSEQAMLQQLKSNLERNLHQLDSGYENGRSFEVGIQELQKRVLSWEEELPRREKYLQELRSGLDQYRSHVQWRQKYDRTKQDVDLLCQQVVSHAQKRPIEPPGYVSPDTPEFAARQETQDQLRDAIQAAIREKTLVESGSCPTCSRPATVADFPAKDIAGMEQIYWEYRTSLATFQKYAQEMSSFSLQSEHSLKLLDAAEENLKALEGEPFPCPPNQPVSSEYLASVEQGVRDAEKSLRLTQHTLSGMEARRDLLRSEIAKLEADIISTEESLKKQGSASEAEYLQAQERSVQRVAVNHSRDLIDVQIQKLKADHDQAVDEVDNLEVELIKSQAIADKADALDRLIDLLKPGMLPAAYSRSRLTRVISEVNSRFGGRFSWPGVIAFDPATMELTCGEGDKPIRASFLSGGEKVALGVAFRAVAVRLYAPEVGILVLDEPTAFLDEANVGALSEVLSEIGNEVASWTAQLIVVTHNQALIAGCQAEGANVIRLGD